MSGNEREGLREAIAEIVADHCIDYQGCSGKHEHASLQIADEILSLLTQAQEPVVKAWAVVSWSFDGEDPRQVVAFSPDRAEMEAECARLNADVFRGGYTVEPVGASPVASASDGYDPANEPEALNFLHNIFDLVKHGERAVMDFLALHGDHIQELVTASAPEEEREAYTMAEIYAALSDGSVFDAIMRSLRATQREGGEG